MVVKESRRVLALEAIKILPIRPVFEPEPRQACFLGFPDLDPAPDISQL